ncbi:N-acetylglucosamine-6-phosphate deacetylase [Desulfurococcaceae archaeon AG1]|nr:N-acetylglucosamine-6-phosphate deacetylase [Desulfurococcaceae archaeon AG1]
MDDIARLVLRNAMIATPRHVFRRGYIAIEDGYIVDVGEEPYRNLERYDEISLEGFIAGPGFIDTHTHGAFGIDVTTASSDDIARLSEMVTRFGVTSYIPTSVSMPHEILERFCRSVNTASRMRSGAKILGIHLEGPYINPKRAGAHRVEYIRRPSLEEFSSYLSEAGDLQLIITISPEIEGATDLIKEARRKGVIVQVGHTDATYRETIRAIALGVSRATHLYNAMSGFHHRNPGAAPALLRSRDVYLEIIADMIHVSPEMLEFTIDYASPERVALITDSISATGMDKGRYRLGDLEVEVEEGVPRIPGSDTIAGSILTMDRAFKNIASLGYSVSEAFHMASTTPAKSLGLLEKHRVGLIEPGYRGDIVIMNKEFEIIATLVDGKPLYVSDIAKDLFA